MKIIHIVFDLVSEKIKNLTYDEAMLADGIKQYVEDNHLTDWEDAVKDEKNIKEMVSNYLRPMLGMSPEGLADYFEYYSTVQKFTYLTQSILGMTEATYYGKPLEEDVEEKERVLMELSTQLHRSRTLKDSTDIAMSEALLNIDYIRGNRSNLSMSLAKRVQL